MKLKEYLHDTRRPQRELAEHLGVTVVTVNRWCNGWRVPSARYMPEIKRWTGGQVTADDFYTEGGQQCGKR